MSNFIQNLFSNPRIRLIIASIVLFIFITGIAIYLRSVITSPPKEIKCPDGETYNQIQNQCLPPCPDGKINNPNNLNECIPDCSLKTSPASGQTYSETKKECVFDCGKGVSCSATSSSWFCATDNNNDPFCAAPNCFDSNGNMTLYCNSSQTNNKCARDSSGNLVSGATGIVNGCFTSSNTNNSGSNTPQPLPLNNICQQGYSKITSITPNVCCPVGKTNLINGTCCPKDSNGNSIKQVFTDTNGSKVCCPASSTGLVNGECCDNPQTFSTSAGTQKLCCEKNQGVVGGNCCDTTNICGEICISSLDEEECTVNGPCPTTKVYTESNGKNYCCPETVTDGNCYNVCKYNPDSSIISNGSVISYYNSSGHKIEGIGTTSDGNLTCGYATYQNDNEDKYLTCINNDTTKTSVCDASAMCTTSLISNYSQGGMKSINGNNYYYCSDSGTNYWNGQSGDLEFTYTINPKTGASGPPSMCQNIGMCQKNYPGELSITGSTITSSGENCTVTLECGNLTRITGQSPPPPPIAPVMTTVSGAPIVPSYNGSITETPDKVPEGSASVALGPNANFLYSGIYAKYGTIDGNSSAQNPISGTFCQPAAQGNTYDNNPGDNHGNTILCYNSISTNTNTTKFTPIFYSNVSNGLGCDGNGFITGNSQDSLSCICTMGSTLNTDKKACYNQLAPALITPTAGSTISNWPSTYTPPTQINNLQVFHIPSSSYMTTKFSGGQTIGGAQTRSIIFFKVTNNKYSGINGQYLNWGGGNFIFMSSNLYVNIMYISWDNVSTMNPNGMWQGLPMLRGLLYASSNNAGGGMDDNKLLPIITYNPVQNGTVKLDVYNFSTNNGANSPYVPGSQTGYFLTIAGTTTGFYCIAAVSAILNSSGIHTQNSIYFLAANSATELQWIVPSNTDFINGTSNAPFGTTLPHNLIIVNPLTHISVDASSTTSPDDRFLNSPPSPPNTEAFSVNTITDQISQGTNNKWSYNTIFSNFVSGYDFARNN